MFYITALYKKLGIIFQPVQNLLSGHLYADNDIVANFYILYEKCELNQICQGKYFFLGQNIRKTQKIQDLTNYKKITVLCCFRSN